MQHRLHPSAVVCFNQHVKEIYKMLNLEPTNCFFFFLSQQLTANTAPPTHICALHTSKYRIVQDFFHFLCFCRHKRNMGYAYLFSNKSHCIFQLWYFTNIRSFLVVFTVELLCTDGERGSLFIVLKNRFQ